MPPKQPTPSYAPLWVQSNFSFLEGASHPSELVQQAHTLGLPSMALTDRHGLYSAVQAHMKAKELGIHLIHGAVVHPIALPGARRASTARRAPAPHQSNSPTPKHHSLNSKPNVSSKLQHQQDSSITEAEQRPWEGRGVPRGKTTQLLTAGAPRSSHGPFIRETSSTPHNPLPLLLLAQNRTGYGNLCRLLTKGHANNKNQGGDKGMAHTELNEVLQHNEGLIALCTDPTLLRHLKDTFSDRLYGLYTRHLTPNDEHRLEHRIRRECKQLNIPTVANTQVLYHHAGRRRLQDVLTCIRLGTTLNQAGTQLQPNAEHDLKTHACMHARFADDLPSLHRSLEIAERCTFTLDEIHYVYPGEKRPDGISESDWLRKLTLKGAQHRYPKEVHPQGIPQEVQQQIERELTLIQKLEYGGYFLTMYEIVQFCRRENILCQGRGSAANSVVCYCLGITAIDPIRLDLLFERFLSMERAEPPDIDLDIEHNRREEVIQWMYQRYGRRRAAMVANVVRYRTRSAVRDVGKALGIPETALDRLAKLLGSRFANLQDDALTHAGLDPTAFVHHHMLDLVGQLKTFPRHLSIHPGGFLLGHEPVDTLVPVEPATMENRTVIQWDKYAVEDLGLFKVDLLGLGALTQLHMGFDLLKQHKDIELNMATLPQEDKATYDMISRGETVGVFQIESRAQMTMLPRLKPQTFYDLVVEVALVRPGPIQGNMVHPYLKRRNGEEPEDYPHPALKQALKKTMGIPIFQEQVMKIAILVGGYTGGEADQLRRDMGAWKQSGRIERHEKKLVGRMIENDISREFAERIFSQIRGFGEYGFPESHAASFALIAYATAWLKCHHPEVFACALLNAQPMGFYTPATIVEEAKRAGVTVLPIDIQNSHWNCTLEPLPDRSGLGLTAAYLPCSSGGSTTSASPTPALPGRSHSTPIRTGLPPFDNISQRKNESKTADRRRCAQRKNNPTFDGGCSSSCPRSLQSSTSQPTLALRMGFRHVEGLGVREQSMLELRHKPGGQPYAGLDDLIGRTRLPLKAYTQLAEAGAFDSWNLPRRQALWILRERIHHLKQTLTWQHNRAPKYRFQPLGRHDEIHWDYRASAHSVRGHPMEPMRATLNKYRIPTAAQLNALPDGTRTRYVGRVICRQQPGTATGVTFLTLEDETGFVNGVIWNTVFHKYSVLVRTVQLMGITGSLQAEHNVVHLIADHLWEPHTLDPTFTAPQTPVRSFH